MSYPETLFTALAAASAGGAVYCALCMFAAAAFQRSCKKWRLSAFCILLSAAVVCLAALLVFTPFSTAVMRTRDAVVWVILCTAAGMLCAAFYRFVLPAAGISYFILLFFTLRTLRTNYPLPRAVVPVSVSRGRFVSGVFSGTVCTGEHGVSYIELEVCTLPSRLLFPIPRTWYTFHDPSSRQEKSAGNGNIITRAAGMYVSLLLKHMSVTAVSVPAGADTAAMYIMDCRSVPAVLVRIL